MSECILKLLELIKDPTQPPATRGWAKGVINDLIELEKRS